MARLESLAAQSRGVFLGAAVGDALGWPQEQNSGIVGGNRNRYIDPVAEFRAWTRNGGTQYQRYSDPVPAGSYSDDTQLILATARALQFENWFSHLARREMPLFLLYQRGAGGATLRACRTWASGVAPWEGGSTQKARRTVEQYFSAGGNGVAMRLAPHVVANVTAPVEEVVSHVVLDGIATHGHPRALVGAAAYATAMHILLNAEGTLEFGDLAGLVESEKAWQSMEVGFGKLPKAWMDSAAMSVRDLVGSWDDTIAEMRILLREIGGAARAGTLGNDMGTLKSLGCFDKRVNGAGTVTAAGALYLASRNAPRPMSGLLRAAFVQNADTDTLASMTGALLGALHGSDWLAALAGRLQDRGYIEQVADDCVGRALGEARPEPHPLPAGVSDRDLSVFKDGLGVGRAPKVLPDGRPCELLEDFDLEASGKLRAHRWVLGVAGQTLVVDRTAKLSDAEVARTYETQKAAKPADGGGRLARVSTRARDLRAIERFYGFGLGVPLVRLSGPELLVGGLVRFIEDRNAPAGGLLFSFEVDDLEAVVSRLEAKLAPDAVRLRLRDPAGNDVDVRGVQ